MKLAHAAAAIFMAEMGFMPAFADVNLDGNGISEFLRGSGKAVLTTAQQGYELAVRDGLDGAQRAAFLAHARVRAATLGTHVGAGGAV